MPSTIFFFHKFISFAEIHYIPGVQRIVMSLLYAAVGHIMYNYISSAPHTSYNIWVYEYEYISKIVRRFKGNDFFSLHFISIYAVLCENTVSAKMDFHTLKLRVQHWVRQNLCRENAMYFCWISIIQSIAWILVFDCRLFLCAYQKKSGKKWKLMELKSSYV